MVKWGCNAFVGASPLRVFNGPRLLSSRLYKESTSFFSRRSLSHIQPCFSVVRASLPSPPNDEVDWVIIDMLEEDLASTQRPEGFVEKIQNDAKSLIRVVLRDAAAELSVVLCSDAHIRKLNAQWRGKDVATDVLSFPQDDPDRVVLGDIVISVDTAARQAAERHLELRDELRILLVHGVLHLLGYDHEGEKEGDWLIVSNTILDLRIRTFSSSILPQI